MTDFLCIGCGRITLDDDSGCVADDLCADCTPAEGRCLDCRDERAEQRAEFTRQYALENEVCS